MLSTGDNYNDIYEEYKGNLPALHPDPPAKCHVLERSRLRWSSGFLYRRWVGRTGGASLGRRQSASWWDRRSDGPATA